MILCACLVVYNNARENNSLTFRCYSGHFWVMCSINAVTQLKECAEKNRKRIKLKCKHLNYLIFYL